VELPVNTFKRALNAGKSPIGLWCSLSNNYVVEVLAGAGFDWLLVDTEHSPNELDMVLSQLQAVAPYPTHPVVRVPWNDMVTIKRYLDIGAQTLLIPYVQNEEEARKAVASMRYPLEGLRGMGGTTRATRFGRIKDYARRAHEELCLLVQVETQTALDNLEKIAAVDGVDGVFIGPADLHASLGYAGETANPNVMPLIDDAIGRIRKAGKAPGILTGVEANAMHWLELGCQFVAVGTDAVILARESERLAAKFHERLRPTGRSDQEHERLANARPTGRSDQEKEQAK
jgi:4-hydroxy-2-oxoheptanedioate aldolase